MQKQHIIIQNINMIHFTYGDTKQLSTYEVANMKYPNLYSQEIGYGIEEIFNTIGLDVNDGKKDGVTDVNGITTYSTVTGIADESITGIDSYMTYTYYNYRTERNLNTNLGINTAPEGLIKTGTSYWLATRCIGSSEGMINFYVRCLNLEGNTDNSGCVYRSSGRAVTKNYSVRPVVSLKSSIKLTKDLVNSTEEITYWNIEY